MKVKTSELTGHALDWAVARCEGGVGVDQLIGTWYSPSTNWTQGGAIIERERIRIDPRGVWCAAHDSCEWTYYTGETPLIAAMRCFVASKMGDEVEIPYEVVGG